LNFKQFIEESQKNKELMIMSVRDIAKQKAFGVAVFNSNNIVYGFTRRRYVNMGVYFIRKEIKKYIKENIWQDIDGTLIPDLIRDKQLKAYIHKGFFFDIGTRRVISKFNKNKKEK
jgi:NDP-sugar pyrophosphorylase family protein